jgi:hypothetical protein
MEQKRRHVVEIAPRGMTIEIQFSRLRRALVFLLSVDGRPSSFEVRLGELLVNLRIPEAQVVGCLRRALTFVGKDEREDFKSAA